MKKLIIILLAVLPLFGCVATAVVAGAAAGTAGGVIIRDKRSFSTMTKDHNARAYARYALDNDPLLKKHAHISVTVFNHVALLVGQAQTAEVRSRATKIVSKVPNIKRVYNEINLAGPTTTLERTNDAWITTKVRTALLTKSGLHSNNLKVVTENGVVYLMGHITKQQAALATDAARRVSGVTKVVKVFQYKE